jgi:XTP/dITP diphosphohydrolase
MELTLVTSNKNKFGETREIAQDYGIDLKYEAVDIPEIRGTLEEIVQDKARRSFEAVGRPVLVDDSGFFLNAWRGFPGPFSAFALERLGCEGILSLMEDVKDRSAEFRCAAAYYDGKDLRVRLGIVHGRVTEEQRGSGGFGYDPIFIPDGHHRTFAEDFRFKMRVSHRRRAFRELFAALKEKAEQKERDDKKGK